jgi:dipeptidyl aminopeptidase/acylaminoacyl peptidase
VVTLLVDGQERQFRTSVETVGELLAKAGIELGDLDRVEPAEYTAIRDGSVITIVRVRHETETETQPIPYEKQVVPDVSLPAGESRVLEAGENGEEQLVYRVVYEDDVQIERALVRRITTKEARPETVLVGRRDAFTPTPIAGTIVYLAGNTEVGYNAWVMRGSSGSSRPLTSDGTLDTRVFTLSPDGTLALFTRHISETASDDGEHLNSLWLLDTTLRDAEPIELDLTDVLWADWSPDGEQIAYSTGKVGGGIGWQAHNDLWIADLNEQLRLLRRRRIVEPGAGGQYGWWGASYAWSPNGRYIAYAQANSIGLIQTRDGKQIELQRFEPYNTRSNWVWVPELSWSPDSRFLTGVVHGPSVTGDPPEDSQVFDIWVLDVERPLAVKQINEAGMWATPAWSSAYTDTVEGQASRIAFGRAQSPYESNNSFYDLYIMDRDGSNRRRIYPAEGDLGLKTPHVAWGPGGTQLITVHQNDLFLIDLSQDAPRRLTLDGNVLRLVWAQ